MIPGMAAWRWLVAGFSVALFGISLFLPALLFTVHEPVYGGETLAWGWWGLLTGDFAWFANPTFALALVAFLLNWIRTTRLLTAVALGLGALSIFTTEWWFNEGSSTPIVGLGSAFYVWMCSLGVLFIASWMAKPAQTSGMGTAVSRM